METWGSSSVFSSVRDGRVKFGSAGEIKRGCIKSAINLGAYVYVWGGELRALVQHDD